MSPQHYSMIIQWDPEDQIYIISVPELPGAKTHGRTYDEAIANILEVIELWIEAAQEAGRPVPPPRVYAAA